MNRVGLSLLLAQLTFFSAFIASARADQISLQFQKKSENQGEVALHSEMALPVSAMYPEYTIEWSTNMQTWQTLGGPISGGIGVSDEQLRLAVPLMGDNAFYRVVANVKLAPAGGGGGDAIYGYGTEFSRELQSLGQLSLDDFVAMYEPTNQYLPQITFDPTTAEFWSNFNGNPRFQLNGEEIAVFQTNGFVVSERLGTYSFGDAFYDIFTADLPVYFSADAALHAWHFSYRSMLEELETTSLASMLQQIVLGMQEQIPELWAETTNTIMRNGVLDADYYLAVARSLSTATNHYGLLGQSNRVARTLQDINSLQTQMDVPLFGEPRPFMDFSQFRVRGHYESSKVLSNYFRATMWCGFVDFRFSGETNEPGVRELSGSIALNWLLDRSGQYTKWAKFDRTIELFVGLSDSMNFTQLGGLLNEAGIHSPTNLVSLEQLLAFQDQLMSGTLGLQAIVSDWHINNPFGPEQLKLPRSFRFMGQRFVLDSWCLSKCVYSRIIWDNEAVGRRVPSALDVAFGVFGNDHIVPEIAERIARTNLTPADGRIYWRDGYPYQPNLAAVRNVVDKQDPEAWTNNIYSRWLACLRELSTPATGSEYPEAMRTRAWAMKDLNTQLASWTQLRHDTVLYAKQSYTDPVTCSYPDGFVEPRPLFWQRMREMAQRTRNLTADLPGGGTIQSSRLAFLENFATTMGVLQGIAEKELALQPLSTNEVTFLQSLIREWSINGCGTTEWYFDGWYPSLFYPGVHAPLGAWPYPYSFGEGPDEWDALVTDVHTDTFDEVRGDPGSVLHEGVGDVNLLMIAVDCGPDDRAVYAGPVLSHYEFEKQLDTRMTDSEWKANIQSGTIPPQPDWTRSYLVPRP